MKNEADLRVKYYEREAQQSREKFMGTLAELRHRADPRVMATEAVENVASRAVQMFDDTTAAVRKRPGKSIGSIAGFAIGVGLQIWLARRKIRTDAT